jgi:two-component system, NarL family, nitrate/nitrite response regulator NarL
MEPPPFSVIIIEPHALLREGLAHVLRTGRFSVAASAASLSDLASEALQQNGRTLLIIGWNGDLSVALEQIKLFKKKNPDGRVAMLGTRNGPADIIAAFQCGANIFFDSGERSEVFIKGLELVMLDQTVLPRELLSYIRLAKEGGAQRNDEWPPSYSSRKGLQFAEHEWSQLSFRESCVLRCIAEGASNKVIAQKINITEATVKVHVKAILRKIRVRNRTQAAIWAVSHAGGSVEGYDLLNAALAAPSSDVSTH